MVKVGAEILVPDDCKLIIPFREPARPSDNVSDDAASVIENTVPNGLVILNDERVGSESVKLLLVETIPPLFRLSTPVTVRFC